MEVAIIIIVCEEYLSENVISLQKISLFRRAKNKQIIIVGINKS
jgi:hypothetical protein